MDEMKLTGNALRGSRPILSFDKSFELQPHLLLLKELFVQVRTRGRVPSVAHREYPIAGIWHAQGPSEEQAVL